MINILFRTFILYVLVLFIVRVMGKGDLSKMDPFQLVVLFMIAELAALPIETPEISLFPGLLALLTLLFIDVIFSFISMKSKGFRNLISGKASILVEKGKLNEKEMKRLRISVDDLTQQLRIKNYPSIDNIDYAIIEANGDMSVIPKPEKSPVTREDLGISTEEEYLPLVLIADGILYQGNLNKYGKDQSYLKGQLSAKGITDFSQVLLCFSTEKGKLQVIPKSETNNNPEYFPEDKGWDVE